MKTTIAILLCSASALFGQGFTHADPTWPAAYLAASAGGGGPPSPDYWYTATNGIADPVSGHNITNWMDLTANGRDLVRDAGFAGYGTYLASPPAVRFTASNGLYTNNYATTKPVTLFLYLKMAAPTGQYNVITQIKTGDVNRHIRWDNTNKRFEITETGGSLVSGATIDSMITIPILLTVIWNGSSSEVRLNGVPYLTGVNPGVGTSSFPFMIGGLGGSATFAGDYYAIKGYASLLSSNDIYVVETAMFPANILDTSESYADSATVNGLNGGTGFDSAYVAN